jgi:hypothetical protein
VENGIFQKSLQRFFRNLAWSWGVNKAENIARPFFIYLSVLSKTVHLCKTTFYRQPRFPKLVRLVA